MNSRITTHKILVVEDDPDFAADLKLWLTRDGFRVHVAQVGKAAIQFYRLYQPYSAVLLDLHMPKVDGFKVLKEIKNTDISSRVVVITGDVKACDRVSALGADLFLVKPINKEDICNLIHGMVTASVN